MHFVIFIHLKQKYFYTWSTMSTKRGFTVIKWSIELNIKFPYANLQFYHVIAHYLLVFMLYFSELIFGNKYHEILLRCTFHHRRAKNEYPAYPKRLLWSSGNYIYRLFENRVRTESWILALLEEDLYSSHHMMENVLTWGFSGQAYRQTENRVLKLV